VTAIVGRDDPDPAKMKPSPHLVNAALSQVDAKPADVFLIGDSASDVQAGHLAGVAVIGYANKNGKTEFLAEAGADAVTIKLADISSAIQASARS
jgi:phosphoglycolate phosphatase-like HAD superfamily hydrolase